MPTILTSAPVVEKRLEALKTRCQELKDKGLTPTMRVLLVGENKASVLYTNNKKKFMEKFGADCEIIKLPDDISRDDFLSKVKEIAEDRSNHGCFVQLPLPKQLADIDVGQLIPPHKDVDGFHMENLYHLMHGDKGDKSLLPCTPKGCITLLQHYGYEISGKKVVVIGRSMIVGKPLSLLMTNHNATVTVCHSRTPDLKEYTHNADVIVSAIGIPRFIKKEHLNPNRTDQILVDVGINHDENGKLCGDMDFENLKDHCEAITPVPKGVGPMTILSLAENLLEAAGRN